MEQEQVDQDSLLDFILESEKEYPVPLTPSWQCNSMSFLLSQDMLSSQSPYMSAIFEDSLGSILAEPCSEPVRGDEFLLSKRTTDWKPDPTDRNQLQVAPVSAGGRLNERIELVNGSIQLL
jgi:hypothetical protein